MATSAQGLEDSGGTQTTRKRRQGTGPARGSRQTKKQHIERLEEENRELRTKLGTMEAVLDKITAELGEVKVGIRSLYAMQSMACTPQAQSQTPDWVLQTDFPDLDAAVLGGGYARFPCWQCESVYRHSLHQENKAPGL